MGGLAVVSDGGMRASDSDREKVVEVLGVAYTEGRLTLDEFDDRTTAAYSAKTWDDLRTLTSDLPAGSHLTGPNLAGTNLAGTDLGDPRSAGRPQVPDAVPAGTSPQPIRRPLFVPFLPLAILCLLLATSVHAAVLLIPAVIMLVVWRGARHRRFHGQGPRGGYHPPPGGTLPPRPGGIPPHTPPRTGGGPA
jgi:Domain of unknown function (DUF1707)